jgi:DNA-binding CsgD family transcriptional regulator
MVKYLENLSPSSSLNAMEKEILLLIKEGNTMKYISEKLSISTKVIEYRLRKIRLIYSAKNNTELIGKSTQDFV